MISSSRRAFGSFLIASAVAIALGLHHARADGPEKGKPPLPPLNAKVAEFARSHVGEPVGDGICITLAVEALRASGGKRFPMNDPKGEYVWGEPVADFKDVLPGDILQFRDAEFAGDRFVGKGRRENWHETYPHHTAIVVGTGENGRLITICHQNVEQAGGDPSKVGNVREAVLRMNSLKKGGQVRAYRPIAADSGRPKSASMRKTPDYP